MSTMTATEARARLPEILDRVSRGEEVTITRHNQPVAVVRAPDTVRHRRAAAAAVIARADALGAEMDRLSKEPLKLTGAITAEYAEELIREIRAERDAS